MARKKSQLPTASHASRGGQAVQPAWLPFAWGAALVLLVLLVYGQSLSNGFIWDDDYYVENNDTLRSVDGLRRIWLEQGSVPQYYPFVHTVFWVEYHLWGLWSPGYHLVNVLLHAAAAVLLWRLLARLAVPGAWLAAAIFAVHPVEVETVAWITEQKNTLSAVFALLSILAYLRFSPPEQTDERVAGARPAWGYYTLSLLCYVLALWSKTVTASVPAVLLVVYWWKRGQISRRDVALLAPFFVIGILLASVTVAMERTNVGAVGAPWSLGLAARCLVGGRALWFYASELVWPVNLNFFYPRWDISVRNLRQYAYPLAALGAIFFLWFERPRLGRGPLAAVLIFAGVLVPALGFFNVYPFRYSFVADHFQYHASMALIALAVAAAVTAWTKLMEPPGGLAQAVGICVVAALGYLAWQRTLVYRNQLALFEDVVARDSESWIGHNNLGTLYLTSGQLAPAIQHLTKATQLNPSYLETHNALATAHSVAGDDLSAIDWLERALAVPDAPQSHVALTCNNLAWTLATCRDERYRDAQRAVELAEKAVQLSPKTGAYYSTQGVALYRAGDDRRAITALEKSIELRAGGDSSDRFFLAMAYERLGDRTAAERWYADALQKWRTEAPISMESQRIQAEAQRVVLGK